MPIFFPLVIYCLPIVSVSRQASYYERVDIYSYLGSTASMHGWRVRTVRWQRLIYEKILKAYHRPYASALIACHFLKSISLPDFVSYEPEHPHLKQAGALPVIVGSAASRCYPAMTNLKRTKNIKKQGHVDVCIPI